MKIVANSERTAKPGPEVWFTGLVWIDPVVEPAAPSRLQSALVTFAPGARTHWHTHPLGQTLLVVSGLGWVQRQGEPVTTIRPGDVVVIAGGENHWHGAAAGRTMVHLAMQEADESGTTVVWGDPVSDQQYQVGSTE